MEAYATPFEWLLYGYSMGLGFTMTVWYLAYLWNLKVIHVDRIG